MMAQAAIPLDIRIVLLADRADDAAAQVVPDVIIGAPSDIGAMTRLAERVDVVTFDHELVDVDVLRQLEANGHRVAPTSATMTLAQNKRLQREQLSNSGFPNPRFLSTDHAADAIAFAVEVGWPVVVKAAQGGYDGRGVWIVRSEDELQALLADLNDRGVPPLVEEFLPLDGEIAVLVARNTRGETIVYPPIETVQRDGICNELRVPAIGSGDLLGQAERIATEIAGQIAMIGIMAIEFFISGGRLLVNELAPRPHNSGHWTIDGAETSQFEQHLRAVLGLPLGSTSLTAPQVSTVNILGIVGGADPRDVLAEGLMIPGAHIHLYGKTPRPARKLGHVTVTGEDREQVFELASRAAEILVRPAVGATK
jgi:5-(carboxyamino)imidazole ribonucleotide synthase